MTDSPDTSRYPGASGSPVPDPATPTADAPAPAPSSQPAPTAAAADRPAPPQPSAPGTSGLATAALCLDAVSTAGSLLLITTVTAAATSAGASPPAFFFLVMTLVIGWMLLRTLALVLVRCGLAWARWPYVAIVVFGALCLFGVMPDLPITGYLFVAALLPLIFIFVPPTTHWLEWKAWARGQVPGQA